ncbi:hypothetical protein B1987_20750 [Mycobacterium kansasii]|nr:hypothetical protein B1987_20750 [Mycobacterium kansasii]
MLGVAAATSTQTVLPCTNLEGPEGWRLPRIGAITSKSLSTASKAPPRFWRPRSWEGRGSTVAGQTTIGRHRPGFHGILRSGVG